MAGAYCRYCGHRCFVYRQVIEPPWSGHMATCAEGKAHDRAALGHDADSAYNPADRSPCPSRDDRGPRCFNHERETCCQCGAPTAA